jgi:hypothetical protein
MSLLSGPRPKVWEAMDSFVSSTQVPTSELIQVLVNSPNQLIMAGFYEFYQLPVLPPLQDPTPSPSVSMDFSTEEQKIEWEIQRLVDHPDTASSYE